MKKCDEKDYIYPFFVFFSSKLYSQEIKMILKLEYGNVEIKLFPDVAPNHVNRFKKLVEEKKYDGVVFHRVIDGFMAQTGDVQYEIQKILIKI